MKKPIIKIENASEATVLWLISIGVLKVTDDGLKVVEEENPVAPTKAQQGLV